MTQHPIIFSGPMVRAILDGRKTMTRRVVTPQPSDSTMQWLTDAEDRKAGGWQWLLEQQMTRWRPDDTLWVREAWRTSPAYNRAPPRDIPRDAPVEYLIDPGCVLTGRYRHPRFMPRWFSRVTLRVTDVRVERVQDISEADAIAEGVTAPAWGARDAFRGLWDSLYAKRGHGWDANPWVSVTTFERVAE